MASQRVGSLAFILGVVISIIAGIVAGMVTAYAGVIILVLVILGLIVGFLNVADKEIQPFLIAAIALIAIGTTSLLPLDTLYNGLGTVLTAMLRNIAAFVAPAALIVALKAVYNLAKTPTV
jgi:hypothetical protein